MTCITRFPGVSKIDDFLDDFLDRHPWAAFPAATLMLGVFPAALLEQAFDQPRLWPRVMVGAVIALIMIAGPLGLLLSRRTRAIGAGMMGIAVGAASLVALAMTIGHRREPIPLADPGQAEWAGAVSMIAVCGAVVCLIAGIYGIWSQARGSKHHAWVEESGHDGRFSAACHCGWRGKAVPDSTAAFVDAGDHANQVEVTIREPVQRP